MEEERWKKENGSEDLTLSLFWKEREIDGEMFYYLFCKENRISTSSMGKRNQKELLE